MQKEMKLDQFIGIFPNALEPELCNKVVRWFDSVSRQNITMSTMQEAGVSACHRNDEVIGIPQMLPEQCFPREWTKQLWENIDICINMYYTQLDISQRITSYFFKVHRVFPTGGFHDWHHEHNFVEPYRTLVWHVNVEVPKSGGETEFLYQSLRVEPKVGQLLIWPAAFTHKHRGNPPLEGQKTYLTGWFDCIVDPPPPKK